MTIMMNGSARARQPNFTTEQIANMLANQLGQPVTDVTGLKGKYDFTLAWSTGGMMRAVPPPAPGGSETPWQACPNPIPAPPSSKPFKSILDSG
jgi:uncharacterized protein (TIGR03435 family)